MGERGGAVCYSLIQPAWGGGGGGGRCPLSADSTSGGGEEGCCPLLADSTRTGGGAAVRFRLIQPAGWGLSCLLSADSTSEIRFWPIQPAWGGGGAVRFQPIQPVGGCACM